MAADLGISIAEKLFEAIGNELIKEVCQMWGYKSQLEDLKQTVSTIRKVLLDAEAKRKLSYEEQDYIAKLKDAVYDADDLFDEFLTLAELKQLRPLSKRGKLYEKVRSFFSSKNQLGQAYRMSRDVKDIKKRLDAIADSHQKFGFSVDYKPISRRREETCSYVDSNKIIGRGKDKEAIIGMLLDHDEELRVVTIVGVGGLGKTTLAQLVYNDDRITKEFSDLRLWVCISDQDGVPFDVKTILCKILEVVDQQKIDSSCTMELVQHQVQERLRGKKYLLFLDDVWNEDREKWLYLKKFLMLGQGRSGVVVTTRSKMTGTIIGENHAHELQGLSPENSWLLFEMSAFDKGDEPENYHEFVEMGKKIVAKCYNIPLAIKVVGSLLFGQGICKWRSFEDTGLAEISNGDNEILSILKLSYHNLCISLKCCFSYCAVFPKDFRIRKQKLIDQWIAQGYIIPLDGGQSIEDTAEEYFLILLKRCFFQDVEKDAYNNIYTIKIHDLMHDVAQEVGRDEICVVNSVANTIGDKIRHVQYVDDSYVITPSESSKIRSFFCSSVSYMRDEKCVVGSKIDNWMCLRVLEMSGVGVKKLPESIGNLLHLRYVDLSRNLDLELLPRAISRLHNLQTLLFYDCSKLRELPEDFCKLVKLRHLDLRGCGKLTSMPLGMDRLTSLRLLPYYVVGKTKTNYNRGLTGADNGLKALKALTGIRGKMEIVIGEDYKEGMNNSEREGLAGEYLKGMQHVARLTIKFNGRCDSNQESVLENLEPPSNVKELEIYGYEGKRIPKWGRAVDNWALSLSRLVDIQIDDCVNLSEMAVLSKLPLLKSLKLLKLDNLEYMEMEMELEITSSEDALFFPSLVYLLIWKLPKLTGWWKEKSCEVVDDHHRHSCCSYNTWTLTFPCLSTLWIYDCPKLMSFPPCPTVESLELKRCSEMRLQSADNTARAGAGNSEDNNIKLRDLKIDNIINLKSLPIDGLTSLTISRAEEEYGLQQVGEVKSLSHLFQRCSSSLRVLHIHQMKTLRRLCGLQHFTALESLSLIDTVVKEEENLLDACYFPPNLRSLNLEETNSLPPGMQCLTSLQTLKIDSCTELQALPEWITNLSCLKSLLIRDCPALKSLPQAMHKLTSLCSLQIWRCRQLEERCKESDGEDRPKIQHIPHIHFGSF